MKNGDLEVNGKRVDEFDLRTLTTEAEFFEWSDTMWVRVHERFPETIGGSISDVFGDEFGAAYVAAWSSIAPGTTLYTVE